MASRSEFADAYKLKPDVLNKRNARLQRRSIEWKNLRYEEVGKRRKIDLDNLSPLQEQDQNVSNLAKNYEDKTPVKPTSEKKTKAELLKQRLIQWKQEKEKKKKQAAEERIKKLPFKVSGVHHKDTTLFTKNKDTGKPTRIKSKDTSSANISHDIPKKASTLSHGKPTANTSQKSAATSKISATTIKPKPQPTARVTRQTRSSAKLKDSPKTKSTFTRSQRTTTSKSATKPEAPKTKSTRGKKPSPEYRIDLAKVSTLRGESFAPSDFTFEAPDCVKSFAFQPLSPASAASFLDPNRDLTSTSFFSHDPPAGRCSTPKSSKEEESNPTEDTLIEQDTSKAETSSSKVTIVKHSPVKQTRSRSAHSSITSSESEADVTNNVTVVPVTVEKKKNPKKFAHAASKGDSEVSTDSEAAPAPLTPRRSCRKSVRQANTGGDHVATTEDASPRKLRKPSKSGSSSTDEEGTSDGKTSVKATKTRSGRKKAEPAADAVMEVTDTVMEKTEVEKIQGDAEEEKVAEKSGEESVGKQTDVSDAEKDMTVVGNTVDKSDKETPIKQKRRHSVRKQMNESHAEADETDNNSVDKSQSEGTTPVKTRRRSVRNEKIVSDGKEDNSSDHASDGASDREAETKIRTPRSARRRSTKKSSNVSVSEVCSEQVVSMEVIQEEKNTTEEVFHPDSESLSETSATPEDTETKPTEVKSSTKLSKEETQGKSATDKENGTPVRNRRCSSSDARFLTPGLPMSAQRSGRKRRRTESSANSGEARSPEEWVKILSTSPMVEMRRRTPKAPRLAGDSLSQPLNFDDVLEDPMDVASTSSNDETGRTDVDCAKNVTTEADMEDNVFTKTPETTGTSTADSTRNETVSATAEDKKELEHNVPYFRDLLVSETARLNSSSDEWTEITREATGISEEVEGQIRTTVGQAQLLIAQRFKQFSGLVDNCEFGTGEKETTCTDLQGFWDMIFFQVEDVDRKFVQLSTLRKNNWKEEKPTGKVAKKVIKKKSTVAPKPKTGGGPSKFAAFRAQMKKQKEEAAAAADNAAPVETVKVFDAGFFKVSSPVKSPAPHCEAGSPGKIKSTDSNSSPKDVDVAQALLHKTPRRKSYVPSVPSPLLCDITPKPKLRRSLCVANVNDTAPAVTHSPLGVFTPPEADAPQPLVSVFTPPSTTNTSTTPKRRSIRLRKSLTLTPTEEERSCQAAASNGGQDEVLDACFFQPSGSTSTSTSNDHNNSDCDLAKFMQPTTPSQTSEELDSSFSKFFQPTASASCTRKRSALKKLPSSQRRRSRRSVQFASSLQSSPASHQRLPSTPFNNKETLVPKTRVSHGDYIFTPPKEDDNSDAAAPGSSPVLRGRPRPSLLFTPASQESSSRTGGDNLMVFTP